MKTFREIAEMHYGTEPSNEADKQYRLNRINALEKLLTEQCNIPSVRQRIIDWKELRNNFFNECTTETPREESGKKVNMAPHDLFEWFKREISEYVG